MVLQPLLLPRVDLELPGAPFGPAGLVGRVHLPAVPGVPRHLLQLQHRHSERAGSGAGLYSPPRPPPVSVGSGPGWLWPKLALAEALLSRDTETVTQSSPSSPRGSGRSGSGRRLTRAEEAGGLVPRVPTQRLPHRHPRLQKHPCIQHPSIPPVPPFANKPLQQHSPAFCLPPGCVVT